MQNLLSLCFRRAGAAGAAGLKSRTQSRLVLLGLLWALVVGWLAASAHAQIFDPFNYPPGLNLVGQSPVPPLTWVGAGPAGPQQARTQAGVLQWPGLFNSVPNRVIIRAGNGPSSLLVFGTLDSADNYPPITSGTIYFSFILRVTDLTGLGAGGNYFAGFTPDQTGGVVTPTAVFTRVLLRTSGAGYNIGLVKSSTTPADFQWDTTVFAVGDTVLLVGSYTFNGENADVSQLWINPNPTTFCSSLPPACPPACPLLMSFAGPDAAQLASFAYLQRPTPAQPTAMITDELRVSRLWNSVVQPGWDYSDAPPPYRTLYADIGARHTVVPGIYMGTLIDIECDGLPTVPADGDDLDNLDDGDGVTWTGPWHRGGNKDIQVTVSVDGKLDAFFDWNHDGDWIDLGEQVFTSQSVSAGVNSLTVTVPAGAATGYTYARFRFSIAGGLAAIGPAPDGEVEDYRMFVEALPVPPDLAVAVNFWPNAVIDTSNFTYSVTVTNGGGGAASGVVVSNPIPAGISVVSATTSQGSCSNSASSVVCNLGTLPPGGTATINVVGIPDFNQLATVLNIPETQETIDVTNTLTVTATEADATPADNIAVVVVPIVPQRDFGDAPQPPYPTLLPNGARHRLGALHFGNFIDAEPNGQPVDFDDVIGVADEITDGFGLPAGGFYAGGWTPIVIMVSGPAGYIDMWMDVDGVPGWGAADHVMAAVAHPGGGAAVGYMIALPPGAITGMTWARARVHKNAAGLLPVNYGGSGEVVDFQINILPAMGDLNVVLGPVPSELQEGDLLPITATVSNAGPSTATSVQLAFSIPTGIVLQSVTSDHGSCQVQGSNVTCLVGTLTAQESFKVQAVIAVDPEFGGQTGSEFFDIWMEISVRAAESDPNSTNNQFLAHLIVFPKLDFGDARLGYPVTRAENGARHRNGAVWHMGMYFDREANGVHSALADADDLAGVPDDEDGVNIPVPLLAGRTHNVMVNVPVAGFLDAFFDFNNDGDWIDAGERVTPAGGLPIGPGLIAVPVAVPLGAVPGSPHARFRFSDVGGLAPTGFHFFGEVEDHQCEIRRVDFGSAPDPLYPTLLANNGARHVVDPAWYLGVAIDWEADGLDSADGDGVVFMAPLTPGLPAAVQVTASIAGFVDGFIDFYGNGNWTDANERITLAAGTPVMAGPNVINFIVPADAIPGATWARFRFGNAGGLASTGPANIGEVEDYPVTIMPSLVAVFDGLEHLAEGNATVTVSSNGLEISNLNSSNSAVRINLGRAEGWRGDVTSFYDWSDIIWSARGSIGGQSNQPLGSLRIERAGSNLTFSADFSGLGASQYIAEYYDQSGVHLSSTPPMSARQSITILGCVCHIEVFADSIYILVCDCDFDIPGGGFPGGSPGGVLVKLSAVAPPARPDFVSAVEITGTGSLTLGSEALRQFGLWHRFVGGASVGMQDQPTLRVGNLGSSGADGIETIVGGPEYIGELPAGNLLRQRVVQFWCCWDDWFLTSSNSHVRWTATGRVTGSVNGFETLSDLSSFKQEQGTTLSASFAALGATQAQVDVFDGLAHVGSFTLPGLGKFNASTGGVARIAAAITDGTPVWTVKWDTRSAFAPSNGVPLIGDRLRISAVNPTRAVEGLHSLITRGANVESFTMSGFNTATPQRPRLSAPRLLPGGRLELQIPTEPDVTYDIERSASVNGPWTRIGTVMGTDSTNTTSFFDLFVGDLGFHRVRVR